MTVIEYERGGAVCFRSAPDWARACSQPVRRDVHWLRIGDLYAAEPCFLDSGVFWCWSEATGPEPQRLHGDVRAVTEGGSYRLRAFSTNDPSFCVASRSGQIHCVEDAEASVEIGSDNFFACERFENTIRCIDDEAHEVFRSGVAVRRQSRWGRARGCVEFPSGLRTGPDHLPCPSIAPARTCGVDANIPTVLLCEGEEFGHHVSGDIVGGCFLPSGVFDSCEFDGLPRVTARGPIRSSAADSNGESVCVLLDEGVECWGLGPSAERERFWWHGATACPEDTIRCGLDRRWLAEPEHE